MNVAAAAGTDVSGTPLYSPIQAPTNGPAGDVVTPAITAPVGSLLYAWTKNETDANAVALDGYSLDPHSSAFLWAEYAMAASTGTYSGHFTTASLSGGRQRSWR
jgi:hypothetical protein